MPYTQVKFEKKNQQKCVAQNNKDFIYKIKDLLILNITMQKKNHKHK